MLRLTSRFIILIRENTMLRLICSGLLSLIATLAVAATPKLDPSIDYHSQANPHEVLTTHLTLDLSVSFKKQELSGSVIFDFERKADKVSELVLDTRDLTIVAASARVDGKWQKTGFKLEAPHTAL
ncbi:hypothetical protein, partial [Halorubrum tibetense]